MKTNGWVRTTLLAAAFSCIVACGGEGSGNAPGPVVVTPPTETPTGLWITGGDGSAMAFFRAAVNADNAQSDVASPSADNGESFSGTYTVEAGIDEHDFVKYNGEILAAVDIGRFGDRGPVNMYRTTPASGQADFLAAIPGDPTMPVEGVYLSNTELQVLSSSAAVGIWGPDFGLPDPWQAQEVALSTWSISDATAPVQTGVLAVEGALVLSRKTDDRIQLVTRHTPVIDGLVYHPQNEAQRAANEALLDSVSDEALLPSVTWNDEPVMLPDIDSCYRSDPEHSLALAAPVEVSVTLLLSVSASTGEVLKSACILDPVNGFMMSEDSLLITYVDYREMITQTWVHALAADDFSYRGSGRVNGRLYSGGNADFRINQFEGVIRLVTTQWVDDASDRFDHTLYTLRPNASRPELDIIGQLPEADAEEELGKPNEDLYGVRFIGDRAFLVTFESVDPLYVIDLADPTSPAVAGFLEVPGFSDLLHPIGRDLLLGVGLSADSRAKVELFDVRDITEPSSLGALEFFSDYQSSVSPAQHNRHAITTLPNDSGERFVLPVKAWRQTGSRPETAAQAAFFELDTTGEQASLRLQGAIDFADGSWVSSSTRSIIHDGAVYVVTRGELFAGFWSNPESLQRIAIE